MYILRPLPSRGARPPVTLGPTSRTASRRGRPPAGLDAAKALERRAIGAAAGRLVGRRLVIGDTVALEFVGLIEISGTARNACCEASRRRNDGIE